MLVTGASLGAAAKGGSSSWLGVDQPNGPTAMMILSPVGYERSQQIKSPKWVDSHGNMAATKKLQQQRNWAYYTYSTCHFISKNKIPSNTFELLHDFVLQVKPKFDFRCLVF